MPKLQHAMYASLAGVSFGLGVVGLFVPLMPTTCFMLLAVWLASKGSPRFALWIRRHPRFGPPIRAWEGERAIPRHAKRLAAGMLAVSAAIIVFTVDSLWLSGMLVVGLALLALWIVTRPEPRRLTPERGVAPSAIEPAADCLSTQRLSTERVGR
ncbi:hypothetical protein SAMN05661010_03154 [Modicisalibacter muralis]|uniref:Inner membrane protein n=1 Tax=Modicisalibacter muralis TaxID=119000 RepID=A0A1G9PV42_9GAMM|nr:YbaN family protein [Halomonas muralis]SDM02652.1 hypothetical protein SAMN05661010_03154 [Halomonas muralis]